MSWHSANKDGLPEPDWSTARQHLQKAVAHLQTALKYAPDNKNYLKILGDAKEALNELRPAGKP
jgi:hypothetical protein